jgi:hypothetical protein
MKDRIKSVMLHGITGLERVNLLFHAVPFKVVSLLLVALSLAVVLLFAAFANILCMELHKLWPVFFGYYEIFSMVPC